MTVKTVIRFPVDDEVLSRLHAIAFGSDPSVVRPWSRRLQKHALTWVGAFDGADLVGFVQVCWDGGSHAFILDTAVDPNHQGEGIGTLIVQRAADEARAAGCEWLHVDFEPHLEHFYFDRCGFVSTPAGVIQLNRAPS